MTQTSERCPHCIIEPMYAAVSPWGGCYLQCLGCGYYDAIQRKPDPRPSTPTIEIHKDGYKRIRHRMPPRRFMNLTNADGLVLLRRFAKKLNRTPKVDELGKDCPTASWYRSRWGTYNKSVLEAGLTPRKRGQNKVRRAA
jgi:hypothetical protein